MNKTRLKLFKEALSATEAEFAKYPDESALESVRNQLLYLINLEEGMHHDWSRLSLITVGLLGARELGGVIPDELTQLLYDVQGEVRQMM